MTHFMISCNGHFVIKNGGKSPHIGSCDPTFSMSQPPKSKVKLRVHSSAYGTLACCYIKRKQSNTNISFKSTVFTLNYLIPE